MSLYLRAMDIRLKTIEQKDNPGIATIIRNTLTEFNANRPGTVYFDSSTDFLFELFQMPRSNYFVAFLEKKLVGGAGIFPSPGLPEDTCELVKMYLMAHVRGKGVGSLLMEECLQFAKEAGYKKVYLETMPELRKAIHVYEKFNFRSLPGPLGNTGHFGCAIWMMKEL